MRSKLDSSATVFVVESHEEAKQAMIYALKAKGHDKVKDLSSIKSCLSMMATEPCHWIFAPTESELGDLNILQPLSALTRVPEVKHIKVSPMYNEKDKKRGDVLLLSLREG